MGNPHANNYHNIFINLVLSSELQSLTVFARNRSAKASFNDVLYRYNTRLAHKHMVILFDFYLICAHIIVSMHRGGMRPLSILLLLCFARSQSCFI